MSVHVDSKYAIGSVEGHARPKVNEEAVHYARAAKCVLEVFSVVTVEWIAGHIGHPWNELADAAAKQAAHNPEMSATRCFWKCGSPSVTSSAGLVFSLTS